MNWVPNCRQHPSKYARSRRIEYVHWAARLLLLPLQRVTAVLTSGPEELQELRELEVDNEKLRLQLQVSVRHFVCCRVRRPLTYLGAVQDFEATLEKAEIDRCVLSWCAIRSSRSPLVLQR